MNVIPNKMYQLPDGSGFFVAEIGEREQHDLISRIKYHKKGYARRWLWTWRNFRYAYWEAPDRIPFWKAVRWALDVSF